MRDYLHLPSRMLRNVTIALHLWLRGVWEALQLQRCVVYLVLDRSSRLPGLVSQCLFLNGCIFLGSIAWWTWVLRPAFRFLLLATLPGIWGPGVVDAAETALHVTFQLLWLLPAYLVTLMLSSMWYSEVASVAMRVRQQQAALKEELQPASSGTAGVPPAVKGAAVFTSPAKRVPYSPPPSGPPSPQPRGGGGGGQPLEGVAQELYRLILFLVFYAQIWLVSCLPYVGSSLNFVFISWLYAYYCFDYGWGWQGVPLAERVARFERGWAFFAGFGLPMCLTTLLLPFYAGAAVLAVLFPLYILVACGSDPHAIHARVAHSGEVGRVPVFRLAQWPTDLMVTLACRLGGRSTRAS